MLYQWNIHFYLGLIEDQHSSIEVDDLTNGPKFQSNKNNLSLKIVKPQIWKSPWYLKPLPLPQVFQAGLVFIFMRRNKWLFWLKHLLQVLQSSVSPLWRLMWVFNIAHWMNRSPQVPQVYTLSPVCVLMWSASWSLLTKPFPQAYSFTPVWILGPVLRGFSTNITFHPLLPASVTRRRSNMWESFTQFMCAV